MKILVKPSHSFKKLSWISIVFVFILTSLIQLEGSSAATSSNSSSKYGAGFILGSPTALTIKLYENSETAYDLGLAFSNSDYLLFYGDFLKHYPKSIHVKSPIFSSLSPYIGFGGIFVLTTSSRANNDKFFGRSSGSIGLGIRVPLGIEWKPSTPPNLSVFAEFAPGISIVPATDMIFQIGIGLRYLFN